MSTVKQPSGARTAVTVANLNTLASGAYATSNTVNNAVNQPLDLFVEIMVTPGTVAGNKQAVLFALASLDGVNWQTGANAADETDMTFIGSLPLNTNATKQTKIYSVASAYGGPLPPYVQFVVKNDSGVAFSAASISVAEVSSTVT